MSNAKLRAIILIVLCAVTGYLFSATAPGTVNAITRLTTTQTILQRNTCHIAPIMLAAIRLKGCVVAGTQWVGRNLQQRLTSWCVTRSLQKNNFWWLNKAVYFFGNDLHMGSRERQMLLLLAVNNNDISMARTLLIPGFDVNFRDSNGQSTIHYAIIKKNTAMVDLLSGFGANLNALDKHGATPLCRAIENADIDMVRILIKNGVDVNAHEPTGYLPIHRAVQLGCKEIVTALIKSGMGVDTGIFCERGEEESWDCYQHRMDAIYSLLDRDDVSMLELLPKQNLSPDLLKSAIYRGANNIVRFLLEHGIGSARGADRGKPFIFIAIENALRYLNHNTDLVKILIEHGADVNAEWINEGQPQSLLDYLLSFELMPEGAAGEKAWNTIFELLLNAKVNPNGAGLGKYTPLQMKFYEKSIREALLKAGADITLCFSTRQQCIEVISTAASFLPDFKEQLNLGIQLAQAVKDCDEQKVKELVQHNAPLYVRDESSTDNTPLHHAVQAAVDQKKPACNIVKMLVQFGIKNYVNMRNSLGQTPLHIAAHANNWPLYRYLRLHGADMFAKDKYGNMALPPMCVIARCGNNPHLAADVFAPYTNAELDAIKAQRV